ncbi:MAG: PAS domain-containing sensor histidine kinase [Myxococcales bacterium]|nr:PAS domain-containing sensor histidine kinase [Myxococcales bacterium]
MIPPLPSTRPWAYASAVAAVALTTAVGLIAYPELALGDIGMMYLPAVMLAALAGRGPALLAASLAVLAFDLCFVPPRFTFVVENPRHGVTFAVMFVAGLTIATLAERLRGEAASARQADLRARTEELRSSLLSSVSHDLRTPLAVITGAATSAADPAVAAPARAELLESIVAEARRLERMLANLLQLTRVETGIVPTREWVPLDELIGGALTRLEPLLGERAVTVAVGDVEVEVDPVLFELALVNLIENAIKHGAPPIEIGAAVAGGKVAITVRDHGAGVAPGDRGRVFDKFFRASAAPGAGLGLAVVRAIAVAHGGDARVTAPADGGAAFVIELPAARPPTAGGGS